MQASAFLWSFPSRSWKVSNILGQTWWPLSDWCISSCSCCSSTRHKGALPPLSWNRWRQTSLTVLSRDQLPPVKNTSKLISGKNLITYHTTQDKVVSLILCDIRSILWLADILLALEPLISKNQVQLFDDVVLSALIVEHTDMNACLSIIISLLFVHHHI